MRLGSYMRELWGMKIGLAVALIVALLAATRVLYGISLFPPGLERDSLTVASASTRVVVDTPRSTLVDLRETTYDLSALTNRAVLIGNVMASAPVREYIARRVGVAPDLVRVTPPLTPDQPRPIAGTATDTSTTDILNRPDPYRLSIQANPTAPILDIFAEASDAETARRLADAAVVGMKDYLGVVAAKQRTPPGSRVSLIQLGRAHSGVINGGANATITVLVFVSVFAVSCALLLIGTRIRRRPGNAGHLEPPRSGVA